MVNNCWSIRTQNGSFHRKIEKNCLRAFCRTFKNSAISRRRSEPLIFPKIRPNEWGIGLTNIWSINHSFGGLKCCFTGNIEIKTSRGYWVLDFEVIVSYRKLSTGPFEMDCRLYAACTFNHWKFSETDVWKRNLCKMGRKELQIARGSKSRIENGWQRLWKWLIDRSSLVHSWRFITVWILITKVAQSWSWNTEKAHSSAKIRTQ